MIYGYNKLNEHLWGEIALGGTLRNHYKNIERIHTRPFLGEGLVKVNAPNFAVNFERLG